MSGEVGGGKAFRTNQPAARKCVLVVDDEPRIIRFVRSSLIGAGYDVVTASNGQEALDAVASRPPDLMLLDLLMPVMDGYEALRRVRCSYTFPVIVVSARHDAADEVSRLGADACMAKPFRPEDLIGEIHRVLEAGPRK